jgi:O-antigen/teichoic acid export membrane protein
MKREKRISEKYIYYCFGTFLPKLASLITLPIITGALTKTEYGTYDLISTLASLFLPFATLQIQSAAFRFLIDCRDNDKERKQVITNIYGFLVPVSLVALTILYFALHNLDTIIRLLICVYFAVDIILLTTQQIIRGLSKNKLYSLSAVAHSIINLLMVLLTISLLDKGLIGVLISIITASIVAIIILLIVGDVVSNIDPSLFSWNTIKGLLSYSWPMIPNSLSNWALSFSDDQL